MKVLFLCASKPNPNKGTGGYGGGGWISSLLAAMAKEKDVCIGAAYATSEKEEQRKTAEGITLLPVYIKPMSPWAKIRLYYGGYKEVDNSEYVCGALKAIKAFAPDVIHLFGLENPFAMVLGQTDVPIACHLQGLLIPCNNAFFPIGMNESSFRWPPTVREWVKRNGYLFAKKSINVRAEEERKLFRKVSYAMGRTEWDKEVSQLLAPQSKYFHVDEVLRQPFYDHAGEWQHKKPTEKLTIVSTLSETIYKGLDLVLKTAKLLKEETDVDFEWNVVGIGTDSHFVRFFERTYGIRSRDVGVRYLGVKQPDEIISLLLNATAYVHTSYIDNSPNSVCEAQMIGCPVIATNVGGISSLVKDGETGLLVPANGPYELAYKLKCLTSDMELQQQLSNGAKKAAAKRHDKQTIVGQLIDTYNTIIAKHGANSNTHHLL